MPLLQIAAVCLIWVAAMSAMPQAQGRTDANAQQPHPAKPYSPARFVFADLDGDQKPDLAQVEMQPQRSASANYSIRVKLGQGSESAIGVNGPVGGLRIVAQDVNGDDVLDLVVTANLDACFLQILLNDGRGNFSVAPQGAFLQPNTQSDEQWEIFTRSHQDLSTLASLRSFREQGPIEQRQTAPIISHASYPAASAERIRRRTAFSRQGRSPPICPISTS
jgi:hypothetical protein